MISTLATSLPPVELTDSAMRLASVLLQIAADPAGTQTRLSELAAATQTLRDSIAANEAATATANATAAGLAGLQAQAQDLANREDSLLKANTQLQVAANALASRDATVTDREAASDRRAADLDKREADIAQKLANYRAALA
jgi:uncharacterized protein (DUF3084 family)